MTKVADLTEYLLDYWVARASGMTAGLMTVDALRTELIADKYSTIREIDSLGDCKERDAACTILAITQANISALQGMVCDGDLFAVRNGGIFEPSTNWAQGGPIMERMRIGVSFGEVAGHWFGLMRADGHIGMRTMATGPTPLEAAMRAFVASRYGDTVPDEAAP